MASTEDRERFDSLFHSHRASVLGYARRRVHPDAAADVVAETFLVAWRRLERVPEDPLPWLYGVARKVVANQQRSDRRSAALINRLKDNLPSLSHERAFSTERSEVLVALKALSKSDREVLMLVAWEGLDPARAACAVGCSRRTFAVRLHRARKRFAAELARCREAIAMKTVSDSLEVTDDFRST